MKGKAATITLQAVRAYVGETSFSRGETYARQGRVSNLRQTGATIKADCQGSEPSPYRVSVEVAGGKIKSSSCTCPIGSACKHVAAVLIQFIENPDDVQQVEDAKSALGRRSKEQLIELIELMLERDPDLEELIELPLSSEMEAEGDVETIARTYRRQAERAFSRAGEEWGYQRGIARELKTITRTGDYFLKKGHIAQAAAAFQAVLDAVVSRADDLYGDEDAALFEAVDDCVSGLSQCLAAGDIGDSLRENILRALMTVVLTDIRHGGTGLGDETESAILDQTTPQEKAQLAKAIRSEIKKYGGSDFSSNWQREALGALLLKLEGDALDDEAFIRICRETGRLHDLIERLLSLKRVGEAAADAQKAEGYELLDLANVFAAHRQTERIVPLIERRAARSDQARDTRFGQWLHDYYAQQKDWPSALKWALHIFRAWPQLSGYQRVRQAVTQSGAWDEVRAQLLEEIQLAGNYTLLTEIYLDEGHIDSALEAFANTQKPRSKPQDWGWGSAGVNKLAVRVAEAATTTRPRQAREIYLDQVERLVDQRNRSAYQEACKLLLRAREIYKALGETDAWRVFLDDFQLRYKQLRALKEEMHKAKLT